MVGKGEPGDAGAPGVPPLSNSWLHRRIPTDLNTTMASISEERKMFSQV